MTLPVAFVIVLLISDRKQGVDVGSIIKTQVAVDLANGPTMPRGHRAKVLDVNVTKAGLTVVKIMDPEGQPRWITRDSVARADGTPQQPALIVAWLPLWA